MTVAETANGCCALSTATGITGVKLTGGITYFMVAGPVTQNDGSRNGWAQTTLGTTSEILGRVNNGSWLHDGNGTAAAFDVLGDASAPEPTSLLLAGSAGVLLLVSRRRLVRK